MLLFDDYGRASGVQSLTAFESRWMQNEQALILCDAAYALTRYCFVINEEGVVGRYQFRVPQRLLFDIISDLEADDVAIEIMILKARQLGMTTLMQLLIMLRIVFGYGVTSVIGSADQSKTSEMSQMLIRAYDMLPCWLRPAYTSRVESDRGHLLFGNQSSGVRFQHGAQKLGIATGSTPTIYHLSEVALYADPVKLIDEGLWKAVHASANVLGVLESTGRSNKGWWADTWYYSRDNWPRSRMCPLFLPWFCGVDIYPKPAWLRKRPLEPAWAPNHDTRLHVAKSELYVRSHPLLARHLGRDWRMPREQQWFWEVNHEEAKAKGAESSFLQEMAGDDEEALQHSEESVFGHEVIRVIDERRERNYLLYGITGQSIEDAHEPPPEMIDYDEPRVPLRYTSSRGDSYRWELAPLAFGKRLPPLVETDAKEPTGMLLVFHQPQPGVSYSIGVDTSAGKGQDSTVISVWTTGARDEPDIQVAEYASAYVNHVEAFAFVMAIATYYRTFMERGVTRWPEPYVSIEQIAAVGDTCQYQMAKMGYSNFHNFKRYDRARVAKRTNARGWFTNSWSRPLLTGNFVNSAKNAWAEINSPWLIEEMKRFEVHETRGGKERLEAEEGEHDDRIFAAAMAIFCPHDMDILAERSKNRMQETKARPAIDLRPINGQSFTPRQLREKGTLTLEDLQYATRAELEREFDRGTR